ncbi:unnamed protein product [Rotaria sp. Silwood2]|nr:unnamed protein product [Rotaria sp. Silwood2]CAF2972653.1 unnamed protein product [Rotaria sp. Silwood2]CAF4229590.1 unnamed protein product [Rotaria sp. Silwood2]CAF4296145.1 unnamed protein product [Rotaria sp. Silwood2]CAF4407509.1 unnamed protein product [Rotaria sp. Silwood2]
MLPYVETETSSPLPITTTTVAWTIETDPTRVNESETIDDITAIDHTSTITYSTIPIDSTTKNITEIHTASTTATDFTVINTSLTTLDSASSNDSTTIDATTSILYSTLINDSTNIDVTTTTLESATINESTTTVTTTTTPDSELTSDSTNINTTTAMLDSTSSNDSTTIDTTTTTPDLEITSHSTNISTTTTTKESTASTASMSTNVTSPTVFSTTTTDFTTADTSSTILITTITTHPTTSRITLATTSIRTTASTTTASAVSTHHMTSTDFTTSHTIITTTRPICNESSHILLSNGTCVSKLDAQIATVNSLRNRTNNSSIIVNALSLYFASIINANITQNSNYIFRPNEIDEFLGTPSNATLIANSNTSFIMFQQLLGYSNVSTVGGVFRRGTGGQVVNTTDARDVTNSSFSAAAFISNEALLGVTSFNMLIIDKPTTYENIDNSTNKTLASSVIVATVQRSGSRNVPMNISLYFQVLNEYQPNRSADYFCSFYDTTNLKWNESGCRRPRYNSTFDRYECICHHLSTFGLVWLPNIICNTSTHVEFPDHGCVSKPEAQVLAVNTLRKTTNSTVIAKYLSIYISLLAHSNAILNQSYTLNVNEIDTLVSKINAPNITENTTDSILVAFQPKQGENRIVLGASFTRGVGGKIVDNFNKDNVTNSYFSTAALISNQSLTGVISINILIIDKPVTYEKADNSSNKTLASSVIVMAIKRDASVSNPMNISLFFQVLDEYKPNKSLKVDYFCSYFDTTNSTWNESGCTIPRYNSTFNRHECVCNHTTSFALIWLPKVPLTRHFNAQDIASLVFQSISICCFLAIIIHAIIIRIRDPIMSLQTYDLPPLISCGMTVILFAFYIALAITVYMKTTFDDEKQCFLSSSVLMFFVYFFLILMLCTKTSVGYFNYLRFVCLFPAPSYRRLLQMLVGSCFISVAWVAFAAGFNSNPSFQITQLYPYKLCWFTRPAIYYFLTIPVGLFLLINIFIFIRVAQRMLRHVRNSTSRHHSHERMKTCVIILLFSCATQGIGWLLGPFLTIATPEAANVLGWIFNIFNGLEGLWVILLYLVIRSQRISEQKRVVAAKEIRKSKESKLKSRKYKKTFEENNQEKDRNITRNTEVKSRNRLKETSHSFDDFRDITMIALRVDNDTRTSYC